jgi:putative transposase
MQVQPLTDPVLGRQLLLAAENYHLRHQWYCLVLLLMPDHIHALVAFPPDKSMTGVVGSWKRYTARFLGVTWQPNFFDHRIRHDHSVSETWDYILRNPVVKGLCAVEADWSWVWRVPE